MSVLPQKLSPAELRAKISQKIYMKDNGDSQSIRLKTNLSIKVVRPKNNASIKPINLLRSQNYSNDQTEAPLKTYHQQSTNSSSGLSEDSSPLRAEPRFPTDFASGRIADNPYVMAQSPVTPELVLDYPKPPSENPYSLSNSNQENVNNDFLFSSLDPSPLKSSSEVQTKIHVDYPTIDDHPSQLSENPYSSNNLESQASKNKPLKSTTQVDDSFEKMLAEPTTFQKPLPKVVPKFENYPLFTTYYDRGEENPDEF